MGGDVDVQKVLVSKKISFGERNCKYFSGDSYDNHKFKLMYIMFPKTTAYVKKVWRTN